METTSHKTVGEFVRNDYRTAQVFQEFGIDFCCKGGKSLEEACREKNIDQKEVLNALTQFATVSDSTSNEFDRWPIDLLADYIEKKHHRYITTVTPTLLQYLDKLCSVHGERHPELFTIRDLFREASANLAMHMKKEELILFPQIRRMMSSGPGLLKEFTGVAGPVSVMLREHEAEGDRFSEISELSNRYTPPADGCMTYRVAFQALRDFESDLHFHIHLENNILFPKALALESALS